MKITGELFGLEDEAIKFILDDGKITLVTENSSMAGFFAPREKFDLVYGETTSGRNIVFIDVSYQKRSNMAVAGWAISKGNVDPDDLKTFDAISFSGKCVDVFYSAQNAFEWEENAEKLWDDPIRKRIPSLVTREFSQYGKDFDVEIEGVEIHIKFDVSIRYNLKRDIRSIGEATPIMQFQFSERQDIKKLPKFYLYAFDLMKFFSFRRNISFDKILLKKKVVERINAGKYDKSADVYFHTVPDSLKYDSGERQVITIDDVGEVFPKLFENICGRRIAGIDDDLYIPLNNDEARTVNYSSFLSAALSFEGEYSRLYPDEKSERDKVFEEIKKNVIQFIDAQDNKFSDRSKKEMNKAKKAINQMKKQIENLDSSLEEKLNRAIKKNHDILVEYIKKVVNQELNGIKCDNWGKRLGDMRNHIGHGNPLPLEREHVAVFRITKCLIYVLILKESAVEIEKIKYIIEKLF